MLRPLKVTMDESWTDSGMVDLYEQMLYERAAQGIRPVLYISSPTDFECSIALLLDESGSRRLAARRRFAAKDRALTSR